jgi:hypothetical protein
MSLVKKFYMVVGNNLGEKMADCAVEGKFCSDLCNKPVKDPSDDVYGYMVPITSIHFVLNPPGNQPL